MHGSAVVEQHEAVVTQYTSTSRAGLWLDFDDCKAAEEVVRVDVGVGRVGELLL